MLPNTLITLGMHSLADNYRLTTVDTNQSLVEIEDLAFSNCQSLVNVELPSSLTTIRYMAFNYCLSLKSITLRENIAYISDYAFRATNLSQICMFRLTPPLIGQDIFNGVNHNTCVLTLPSGASVLTSYKSTNQWKDFANIIQSDYPINYYNVNICYNSGGTIKYNS